MDLNGWFDALPRTRFGAASREVPAFRTCGVTGFYVAVAVALGGGLLAGRSLPVIALLCLTAALSFFAYTYLRRWVTGRETLVLLEHVWFAEACMAGVLMALREPVLAHLDVIAPAMCVFLAAGRMGCLLVGCCHGRPSSLGIVYGEAAVADGFPRHLQGVRLFPVQALELVGLLAIGLTALVALPWAAPGAVFAWFLAGYAVLRFGTEAMRGDKRPHWLGLSVARWMAIAEMGVALWIARDPGSPAERDALVLAVLAAAIPAALYVRRKFDRRPALLAPSHLEELRAVVRGAAVGAIPSGGDFLPPSVSPTSAGVRIGVTPAVSAAGWLHASFSLPDDRRDLLLLCDIVQSAFPAVPPHTAHATPGGVLHVSLPVIAEGTGPEHLDPGALYGALVRHLQGHDHPPPPAPPREVPDAGTLRSRYFGVRPAAGVRAAADGGVPD